MNILKKISVATISIFSFCAISCNPKDENNTKTENQADEKHVFSTASDLGELSKKLDGYWLTDDYLLNIEKSKSIYNNREYTTSLFGFILKKEELMKDISYLHGFTHHEGGYEAPLRYNIQKKCFENNLNKTEAHTFLKNPFELILTDSNLLDLSFKNKQERYRKVEDIESELRKILFEGKYTDLLSDQEIIMQSDGKLTGLTDKNFYNPYYDFGEGLWMDAIFVYSNNRLENQEMYHFKIKGDTLQLFNINGEMPDYTLGVLKYQLIKNN